MQQIFKIASDTAPEKEVLCLLIGMDHIGYCITDQDSAVFSRLEWYSIKSPDVSALTAICKDITPVSKVIVVYDTNTNILVPTALLQGDLTAALYLAGANQQDPELIEHLPGKGISNVYTAPYQVHDWLRLTFPDAGYLHLKTVLADTALSDNHDNGLLSVDICNNDFHLTAVRGQQLLLSQSYPYTNPADVAFYLLKVVEAHGLDQRLVQLQLSGFIEKDSSLYSYLYQYFLNIGFEEAPWQYPADAASLPQHLFTSLYKISKCALLQAH